MFFHNAILQPTMPSFYPTTLPRQMPLTPPEQYGAYLTGLPTTMPSSTLPYYGNNGVDKGYGISSKENYGFAKHSGSSSTFTCNLNGYPTEFDRHTASSYTTSTHYREGAYSHGAAPSLPPMRIAEPPLEDDNSFYQAQPHVQSQPKEEKSVGGVAAHLDYEMEQMVDFVSEMAQGMYELYKSRICLADIDIIRSVQSNCPVAPAFRKYVSQVLSSTRLPSSTILLGLHYMATRMGIMSASGIYTSNSSHVYHMLTTALLLGSKFLDDNTFQNRSWSEVSNIPVADLNALEVEWLQAIKWNLHIDPNDSSGFTSWILQWKRWQAKKVAITIDSLKLTPLDTNIQRQRSIHKQLPPTPIFPPSYSDVMSGANLKDRSQIQWSTPRYDQWSPLGPMTDRSPPSAPETGPNTPEWYGRHGSIGYNQAPPPYSMRTMPPPLQILPSSSQSASFYTPYPQQYTPTSWGGHGMGCGCGHCRPYHDTYPMSYAYGAQPVAG